ncbi:MAG: protein kinase domain-containing protein [Flavobacterium sp.]|uniref:protein kinase domain-containing protein n=1 Tax=Flavobacterium sp. TaxID=239 RepID=UPI003BDA66EE
MPNKQDIITAIKNLDLFLKTPELKGAKPRLKTDGSPFVFAGGFNMVFQLVHNTKKWAFRVWHVPMGENKDRYVAISKYLTNSKLPYFADFIYDENGLLVNGELTDTIRMEWLEGLLLKDYIEKHLNDKAQLESLANDFLEMAKTLKEAKISHGDLQEGNILINDSGKIKLVDYDSICIPEIEGQKELVTGLKGYQHPSRFISSKASLKADYFSELIIYISILGIAADPSLWDKYKVKDTQYLLFNEKDFENIESSTIYADLKGVNATIDALLIILKEYLSNPYYLELKPFTEYFLAPEIISFQANKEEVLRGAEIEFSWTVENALMVKIEPEIGSIPKQGKVSFIPKKNTYTIICENLKVKAEK